MTHPPRFDAVRSEAIRDMLIETVVASHARPRRRARRWLIIGSIAFGSVALAGSAAAVGVSHAGWIAMPAASPGGTPSYAAVPHWPRNANGQTYGAQGDSPVAPDLILATATNGKDGYIYSKDLAAADGSTVTNPSQAVKWTQEHAGKDTYIPVYKSDGKTKIGVFQIGP